MGGTIDEIKRKLGVDPSDSAERSNGPSSDEQSALVRSMTERYLSVLESLDLCGPSESRNEGHVCQLIFLTPVVIRVDRGLAWLNLAANIGGILMTKGSTLVIATTANCKCGRKRKA